VTCKKNVLISDHKRRNMKRRKIRKELEETSKEEAKKDLGFRV
jgi:hypothetical protein